ncbi:hypothetical protein PVAP13_9KG259126 [Panicum virgatum]|uniref:Uncharacterized protein n=1 Tax=Panicum virgatum TaxID=38727 RepID=A0A8T0NRE5_PANVG|nr:hypothetical protein PVAP13_9KG259126 [Panicum virgatum]
MIATSKDLFLTSILILPPRINPLPVRELLTNDSTEWNTHLIHQIFSEPLFKFSKTSGRINLPRLPVSRSPSCSRRRRPSRAALGPCVRLAQREPAVPRLPVPRPPRLARRRRRSRVALGPRVRLARRRRRHALAALAALASPSRCRPPPARRRQLARLLRELHDTDPRASAGSARHRAGAPLLGWHPSSDIEGPPSRSTPAPARRRG